MKIQHSTRRFMAVICAGALMLALAGAAQAAESETVSLFNGKDLAGWKLRSNNPELKETWKVVSQVRLSPDNAGLLVGTGTGGAADAVMLRGPIKGGSDILTEKEFGDCELSVEFMVPRGSNSGIYLMGQYEIQVLDSYGKPDGKLGMGDCGAIYSARVPSVNATKPPGEWQKFEIVFRAPRFQDGKKVENARFVSVKLNGKTIHEDVEVKGGTGGHIGPEKATGPLLLQGDHGIVAYRNIQVKPVQLR
jgi:hypothetical protein